MLLKQWLAWLIFSLLTLVLTFILRAVFKKLGKKPQAGGAIGFLIGLILLFIMTLGASHLYVITGDEQLEHFLVYGEAEYKTSNGQSFTVEDVYGECVVINITSRKVAIEEIVYGSIFDDGAFYVVEGGEMERIGCRKMNYFWEDGPPDEISVSEGTDEVSKWWLRYYRE